MYDICDRIRAWVHARNGNPKRCEMKKFHNLTSVGIQNENEKEGSILRFDVIVKTATKYKSFPFLFRPPVRWY